MNVFCLKYQHRLMAGSGEKVSTSSSDNDVELQYDGNGGSQGLAW